VEIFEFVEAFSMVDIKDEDYHLLEPLIQEILDDIYSAKDELTIKHLHMFQLHSHKEHRFKHITQVGHLINLQQVQQIV
jgi:hypothetical protein